MIPNVMSALNNWTTPVQMRLVSRVAVDFEAVENVLAINGFEAVMEPMPSQKVDRKPEGERSWKWWEVWSTTKLVTDDVVQDQDGLQFRVQSVTDWSQAGYYEYSMVQKPI